MRERAAGCFVQIVEVGGQRGLDIIGRAQTRFRSVTPSKFCPTSAKHLLLYYSTLVRKELSHPINTTSGHLYRVS
jgi:hypothetical protein